MAWAVLLCLCSWWRWCRGSRLWSLFLFSSVVASSLCFCHLVSLQTILCLSLSVSSVTALFFLSFFSAYSPLESIVCFSPSPKFCPPLCPVIFPYIYRMSRERVTIPVQVQGMVAWDGSCAAAAGHGLLFVMVGGMGLLFLH